MLTKVTSLDKLPLIVSQGSAANFGRNQYIHRAAWIRDQVLSQSYVPFAVPCSFRNTEASLSK